MPEESLFIFIDDPLDLHRAHLVPLRDHLERVSFNESVNHDGPVSSRMNVFFDRVSYMAVCNIC